MHLAPAVQRRVAAGVLSAGHARALLALDDGEAQDRLAARIVAEGLSVRAVEEIVAVGGVSRPERAPRVRRPQAPELAAVSQRLSDLLETRVSVELGRRRGKLVVEFASVEDLERIIGQIAPQAVDALHDPATTDAT
jgi:ParB family transcriptional regulator, chromosome partitioning protein